MPSYNKHDPDTWETKQKLSRSSNWQKRIEELLTQKSERAIRTTKLGTGVIYKHVENFIYAVAKAAKAGIIEKWDGEPTVWKIVIPRLDNPETGSNHYIVSTKRGSTEKNLVFRGATYGYLGSGPGNSALIEACFEKLGLNFEVRDGSYVLGIGFL